MVQSKYNMNFILQSDYQIALVHVRAEGSISGEAVGARSAPVVRRLVDVVAIHAQEISVVNLI